MRPLVVGALAALIGIIAAGHAQNASAPGLLRGKAAFGSWYDDAPGKRRHIVASDLPAPYATPSRSNGVRVVARPPNADLNALREAAKLLVAAENPVIVVDKVARTADGVKHMIALAELLQVPVVDQGGRMNMPNTHYLNQTGSAQNLIRSADVIMGLECSDFWNTVNQWIDNGEEHGHGLRESRIKPGTKLITISSVELNTKSNFQDFQRFQVTDIGMAGDAEGRMYNVNADQMAVACAAGFEVDQLVFLTDVDGVLDGAKKLCPELTIADCERLIAEGVATGGMQAKLNAAISALKQGVGQVRIAPGAAPDALSRILGGEQLGTRLVN
jgi:hypothetical protein